MKVISTNISEEKIIKYRGKNVKTGIFKMPVSTGVYLEAEDVKGDVVVDRRYHGGVDKACYLYSLESYTFWKQFYPDLDWTYGMFGENITVLGLDERLLRIGAQYKIGAAIIEVSQPRQPCFKLGVRFESQTIIKKFINTHYSGAYVRVLKSGSVKPEDRLELILDEPENPTMFEAFKCLYFENLEKSLINKVLACEKLAKSCKTDILKRLK